MCPACGATLWPGSRFCHACGARIFERPPAPERFASPLSYTPRHLADRILTSRSALEGEHKRVTVLFCDIHDSTVLAERLGEERMYELLNRFFEHALAEVHHFEGTVNQFLGDGFMALFGAPVALERHEQHAVLAGLGIRRRLYAHFGDVARAASLPFEICIGLNTGLVVVGKIGDNLRMDYTAVGDTTHVAARMQAMAAPGEVLIAQTTYASARAVVDAHSLGPVTVKGKSRPLEMFRVVGVRSPASDVQPRRARPLSRFVGREREMAYLEASLEQTRLGHGQAVAIVSEPGMGKTRLLQEFRRTLAERGADYVEGQCLSYGASMPYLPILDVLRFTCRIVEGDTPAAIQAKVTELLQAMHMDVDASLPYLLHLLGVGDQAAALGSSSAEAVQASTFETLRQLLFRACRRRPLVLAIEDLHWLDRTSEAFLASFVDALAGASVLLVTTYRAGYAPAWINKSYTPQIALLPLPASGSTAIAQEALGAHDEAQPLVREIVLRGEGNPLFLEELAHAVGEHAGAVAGVPDTLLGVLASRIDRLPDSGKRLLQLASVIGREFSARLLSSLWTEGAPFEPELLRLIQLEFVHERPSDSGAVYVFKHALTREAAYSSLLSSRRRLLHGKVGQALEMLYTEGVGAAVDVLAHHFGLSDNDAKAVEYATKAAERAQKRWANAEALEFSEAALRRLSAMPATDASRVLAIDIVLMQAEVRFALGRHAEQLAALENISDAIQDSDDAARRAAWHYWMGFLHSITGGNAEVAVAHCQQASLIAQSARLEELGASADCCLAQVYLGTGELRKAMEIGERALAVFERRGDAWWACRTLAQLSAAANALGEWQRSLDLCKRALAHGESADDLRLKVSAHIRLASTHMQRGDWRAGLAHCDQAQALSPVQYDAAALRAIRGYGLVKAGNTAQGTDEIAQALAWYEKSQQRYTHVQFSAWLAEGLLQSGAQQPAQGLLEAALATCQKLGYRHLEGVAHRLLAQCLAASEPAAAERHLQHAFDTARSVDSRSELARCWLVATSFENQLVDAARMAEVRTQAMASLRALGTIDLA